jgi:hypothetical protein
MSPNVPVLYCFLVIAACSSASSTAHDASDGRGPDGSSTGDSSSDGGMCTYPAGGAAGDGGTFNSVCPTAGCPSGTVCVFEIGGVAGGGGEYCAPIPSECHGTPSCACMAACVCTNSTGLRPEVCSEQNGRIGCDNGIR